MKTLVIAVLSVGLLSAQSAVFNVPTTHVKHNGALHRFGRGTKASFKFAWKMLY